MQVRDPVHNFITLGKEELGVISKRALQRLRGIRQLAMASLVYPGALHTRFDHTLGVMHVAGNMARHLRLSDDDHRIVRFAALLHDIGHGPFSHVSENALERYADRTSLKPDQKKEKIHELVTGLMILHDPELVHALGSNTCEKVAALLASGHGERILRQIVSGPLDADKQDYLLRDSYFCGVQYGLFDHHQLHRSLISIPDDSDDHELMIRPDGVHAVEQYVLAKYYLTSNVYRHKVRLITDQMIVRAIILGIDVDKNEDLLHLYRFDNSAQFIQRYSEWDDSRFMQVFGISARDGKCKELLRRLSERSLLKRVFSARPSEFGATVREELLGVAKPDRDYELQQRRHLVRTQIEQSIAEILSQNGQPVDPCFVIYHAFDIRSAKEMSRNDEASILVNKRPKPVPFEEESSLFRSIISGLNEEFVEIYAPVSWDDHTARDKLCNKIRGEIIEGIESQIKKFKEGQPS